MRRLTSLCLASLLAVTCRSPVNPDEGRFTCTSTKDCGGGYECISQSTGGAFCFKEGTCVTEECNGRDDNCDGRVDETFTAAGDVCPTGAPGPCGDGRNACIDAGVVCVVQYTPVAETCNGVDDDCANGVDDPFNLVTDNQNCGTCGRVCGPGSQCTASACRETNCADGIDNDDAGQADCLDPNCLSVGCGLDGGFNCGALLLPVDAGSLDAGPGDAGAGDDGGMTDAGMDDAGMDDAGMDDAGMTDAGMDDGGMTDAGTDAGEPDSGVPDAGPFDAGFTLVLQCVPRETPCDNGADDDLDGLRDCVDPDCAGQACDGGTCMMGTCR